MNDAEELLRAALLKVPAGLAEHVIRVVDEAARLSAIYDIDRDAVRDRRARPRPAARAQRRTAAGHRGRTGISDR